VCVQTEKESPGFKFLKIKSLRLMFCSHYEAAQDFNNKTFVDLIRLVKERLISQPSQLCLSPPDGNQNVNRVRSEKEKKKWNLTGGLHDINDKLLIKLLTLW
jgi:hypothetical protein